MKNSFIYNSFNILGLPVDSSQKDIGTRIRNISKITAVDGEFSDDFDLYINPKDRVPSIIKECEVRLNDAVDRMTDFFFWFTINSDEDKKIFKAILESNLDYLENLYANGDYFKKKNAAIGFSIIFEKTQKKSDFENALGKWAGFIHDDNFWNNWTKLYKSFDYLDTSSRLIDNYKDAIFAIISEKFFVVSELDDAVDSQIVNKYIEVPDESFEKAIEPHILKIREYKTKLTTYRSSNSLLSANDVINVQIKNDTVQLLKEAIKTNKKLSEAKLLGNPKIARELNGLWSDFLSLAIAVHNKAMQHNNPQIENLEFQEQIILHIQDLSTDPILNDRIKKNSDIAVEMIANLKERKQVGPYYSQLEDLFEKLSIISTDNEVLIDDYLNTFISIYDEVSIEGLLEFESISQFVTGIAGLFNRMAIQIINVERKSLLSQFLLLKFASQYEKQSITSEIRTSAPTYIKRLKFAKSILSEIRLLQIDTELKSTINSNYNSVTETINDLDKIINPPASSSGCYIATYVYGTYDCPDLWMLRRYRDEVLADNFLGRLFIKLYYYLSPRAIKYFGHNPAFNKVASQIVSRIVKRLNRVQVSKEKYFGN